MTDNNLLPIGSIVRIHGQSGEYKVKGYNKDGSYLLYGGTPGHGGFRDSYNIRPVKSKKRVEK
jgi:hypothetical protein